jgi:orotate phosphoribosyltransferase
MKITKQIVAALLDIQAVKISIDPPFTWASGIRSPIYCDNRTLISFPDARALIVDELCHRVRDLAPDYVAGTATAGIPWAAFVAERTGLPMVYVRPEPKGHGTGKQVEGKLESDKKVVLIEDLISTGGSSIKSAQALMKEGNANVLEVLAIVSYGLAKAVAAFEEAKLPVSTIITFEDILEQVKEKGYLKDEQIEMVLKFRESPEEWWDTLNK